MLGDRLIVVDGDGKVSVEIAGGRIIFAGVSPEEVKAAFDSPRRHIHFIDDSQPKPPVRIEGRAWTGR